MEHLKNEIKLVIEPYQNVLIDFGLGTILNVPIVKYAQLVIVKFDCSVTIKSISLAKTAPLTVRIIEVLVSSRLMSKRFANRVIKRSITHSTTESSRTFERWMII